jgi:hypothetical protein
MPLLTELGLQLNYHDIFFETLLARLTYRETDDTMDCLVPKLEAIALDPLFNGQSFLDMIQSRWRLKEGGSSARGNTNQVTRLFQLSIGLQCYYPNPRIQQRRTEPLHPEGNSYYH